MVWTVWVVWIKSNPVISSTLATWEVVDDHSAVASVRVTLDDDVRDPSCLIRATAEDHVTVGDLTFTPVAGNNEVTIRTERMATSVDLVAAPPRGRTTRADRSAQQLSVS